MNWIQITVIVLVLMVVASWASMRLMGMNDWPDDEDDGWSDL